jgi:hypothetical protein
VGNGNQQNAAQPPVVVMLPIQSDRQQVLANAYLIWFGKQ